MKSKPNSSHKTFNLDNDTIKLIKHGSVTNGITESSFVELLVSRWRDSIDPSEELKSISKLESNLKDSLKELEPQKKSAIIRMSLIKELNKKKSIQKPKAIKIIMNKLKEQSISDAEQFASYWSGVLGIPSAQLICEAMEKLKGGK